MALKSAIKVDMPEKGIYKRKIGNAVYVYYTVRAYRNEHGKPTDDRVSIGKLDTSIYYSIYLCSVMSNKQ